MKVNFANFQKCLLSLFSLSLYLFYSSDCYLKKKIQILLFTDARFVVIRFLFLLVVFITGWPAGVLFSLFRFPEWLYTTRHFFLFFFPPIYWLWYFCIHKGHNWKMMAERLFNNNKRRLYILFSPCDQLIRHNDELIVADKNEKKG